MKYTIITVTILGLLFFVGTAIAPETSPPKPDGWANDLRDVLSPDIQPTTASAQQIRVVFVGDILLDRTIRSHGEQIGYENLAVGFNTLFHNADLVIGNLEGPITSQDSVSRAAPVGTANNTRFTNPANSIDFLASNNIQLVSLGNNHIADFGRTGVRETVKILSDAGINHVGNPYTPIDPYVVSKNDITLAFVSYNQFLDPSLDETVRAIKNARTTYDHVIVLTHWGKEYQPTPSTHQKIAAGRLRGAGAKLIVGSHPHVVQPLHRTEQTATFFSLGNFVFDQYWHPAVRCGLVADVTLNKDGIQHIATTTAHLKRDRVTQRATCDLSVDQVLPRTETKAEPEKPNSTSRATVQRVIDGDTIKLANGENVRLIGIDAPETVHPDKDTECYGPEASTALRDLLSGTRITLERDITDRDKYGRLLRYVYLDDVFINEWLVRNGYAHSSSYPPDIKHQESLRIAERTARKEKEGAWSVCDSSFEATNQTQTNDTSHQECVIKGNISYTSKEKIYHIPGCEYYEETVINAEKGERWFCSEEAARNAGWRKAYNCH